MGATPDIVNYCSQGYLNWLTSSNCWPMSLANWQTLKGSSQVAAPPAPTPAQLQEDPNAAIQELTNEELVRQQKLNAGGVQPVYAPVPDSILNLPGTISDAIGKFNPGGWLDGVSWGAVATVIGVGLFGIYAVSALATPGPRRYGR